MVSSEMPKVEPAGALMQRLGRSSSDVDLAQRVGLSLDDVRAAVASGMFDERFYLKSNPDVAAAGIDPFEHHCGCQAVAPRTE
jgi:hypothetical protein